MRSYYAVITLTRVEGLDLLCYELAKAACERVPELHFSGSVRRSAEQRCC